jgi:hypothetical protein
MSRLLFILLIAVSCDLYAQKDTASLNIDLDVLFKGGKKSYRKILLQNCVEPAYLKKEGVNGRVYFEIAVDTSGKMKAEIIRTIDERLDPIVLKALEKTQGKWKPMLVNGRKQEYYYIDYVFFEIR